MGGESRYEIEQNAYIKLVLHALKHKTSAVNGVLLGRISCGDTSNPVVEIVESVSLFHSQIGLLPPLEIALIMIEEYYTAQGLSVVGYFHANERFDDSELGNVAKNIGDHITRYFPQAALLLLDNKKLGALAKAKDRSPVMQVGFALFPSSLVNDCGNLLYTKDATRSWKLVGSEGSNRLSIKEPSANILLLDYVSSEKWKDIIDFDDHLDDISKDWLNSELFNGEEKSIHGNYFSVIGCQLNDDDQFYAIFVMMNWPILILKKKNQELAYPVGEQWPFLVTHETKCSSESSDSCSSESSDSSSLLDNKKLGALAKAKDRSPVMQLYTKDATRSWKLVGSEGSNRLSIKEPSANILLLDYVSSEKWKDIIDFDDHLDDISK
ncbi:unnamed protein product [Ilex paraguariensis]|uniref:MPN domain-containing protein n=1 Tax=Ilex paraguariensis TaxID=185542 RepID=A0ABC8RPX2_9AQUA